MTAGDRFERWVEHLSAAWKDRLRAWLAGVLGFGIEVFMDVLGKAAAPKLKPILDELEATGELPASLKPLFDELRNPEGEFAAALASQAGGAVMGGALSKIMDVLFARASYSIASTFHPLILDPQSIATLWRRGYIKPDQITTYLRKHGLDDDAILQMQQLTEQIAYAQDIVRFAVREVYSPEVAEKFGQYQDFPSEAVPDAFKAGISDELLKKYWAAHWDLPSAGQGYEMLHRGIIDEDTLRLLLRAADVMPFWRDKLIAMSWNVPTRVDVRRFWDMRTIDEARLRELYTAMGYHDKDLEDYILWTKVYSALPDLLARYGNGWITIDDVRAELLALGVPDDRVQEIIETKTKQATGERVESTRDLTKTDIIKGVSKGIITRAEGLELLEELDYDTKEAEYILDVNVAPADEVEEVVKQKDLTKADILNAVKGGVLSITQGRDMLVSLGYSDQEANVLIMVKLGITAEDTAPLLQSSSSPRDFKGFKSLTTAYKIATGREAKAMPQELKDAADKLVEATKAVEDLAAVVKDEEAKLVKAEPRPPEADVALNEARVAYNRALSAKAEAQASYDKLVAKYKAGGK